MRRFELSTHSTEFINRFILTIFVETRRTQAVRVTWSVGPRTENTDTPRGNGHGVSKKEGRVVKDVGR